MKFKRPRFKSNGAMNFTLGHANNLAAHTAHPLLLYLVGYNLAAHTAPSLFISLVGYTALLGVALECLHLCCSILPVRGIWDTLNTNTTQKSE